MLSTVMLRINKNLATTQMPQIWEWLNKLWNISWTEFNTAIKARAEELVTGSGSILLRWRAAQLRGVLCGFKNIN